MLYSAANERTFSFQILFRPKFETNHPFVLGNFILTEPLAGSIGRLKGLESTNLYKNFFDIM